MLHQPKRWLPEKYPNYDELLTAAVEAAVGDSRYVPRIWRRGIGADINALEIQHPDAGKDSGAAAAGVGRESRNNPGSGYTVKAVTRHHGPSERFTANLADLDQSTMNIGYRAGRGIFSALTTWINGKRGIRALPSHCLLVNRRSMRRLRTALCCNQSSKTESSPD